MAKNKSLNYEVLALILLLLSLSFIALPILDATLIEKEPNEIIVRVSIYESGGFDPDEIHLKKGETVKLRFIAMDVTHVILVKSLNIDTGPIHPGHEAVVEFTPEIEGVHMFECATNCSPLHHFMRGKIIVEA
jgi:heme/copper-type cytochrome/quinol oxidase subunit 2